MDDLMAFLNARLDVDERPVVTARMRREIEAKRAIMQRYERESGSRLPGRRVALDILAGPLRDLAAIWRDHTDYRPEWKP